ncbi:8918_t:CDS:1, partial [Acaulospora morrowiae]
RLFVHLWWKRKWLYFGACFNLDQKDEKDEKDEKEIRLTNSCLGVRRDVKSKTYQVTYLKVNAIEIYKRLDYCSRKAFFNPEISISCE